MKKRVLSLVMTLVMMVSLLPNAFAAKQPTFTDVNKDMWCYDYVEFVAKNGYFKGTTETTFSPNGQMTRQQFVTVLARMAGAKVDNSVTAFPDVPAGSYSAGSVAWAVKHGIVTGYADGTFKPTAPVTRQQMCAFMSRFMDYYADVHGAFFLKKGTVSSFADYNQVADYAKAPVDRCRTYGLIVGYAEDNTFRPANTATRAHVAAVITRLADVLRLGGGGGGRPDEYTLTYVDNNADVAEHKVIEVVQEDDNTFTVKGDPSVELDGYVAVDADKNFVAWTGDDGMVKPGAEYVMAGEEATLNALWINPNDLLFSAMFAAADHVNSVAAAKLPAVNNKVGAYASADFAAILADPAADDAARELTVKASASMNADNMVAKVAEIATKYAVDLVSVASVAAAKDEAKEAVALTKSEIREIVTEVLDLIDAKEWVYGEGYRAKLENLIDEIYEEVQSHNEMYKGFKYNNKFIVDGVEVKNGNTVLFSADKNGFVGTTYKRAAARAAKAVAQQLYTQLQTNYAAEEYAYDLELSAALTLVFDYSDDATIYAMVKDFSPVYKMTAELALTQDPDVLGYRYFNGENYVQLTVTDMMQAEYLNAVDTIAVAAMTNRAALAKLEGMVNAAIDAKLTGDAVKYIDKADLKAAVSNWLADNTDTGDAYRANADYYLPFDFFWTLGGTVDAAGNIVPAAGIDASRTLCDNTELEALIDAAVVAAINDTYGVNVNGGTVEEALLTLIESKVDRVNTIEYMGTSVSIDWVDDQVLADTTGTWDAIVRGLLADKKAAVLTGDLATLIASVPGAEAYLDVKILNEIGLDDSYPVPSDEDRVIAALADAAIAQYDIDPDAMIAAAVGEYAKYLNQIGLVRTFEGLSTVQVSKLVSVLRNDYFLDYVKGFEQAPALLNNLAKAIAKIDDNASEIVIDGVVISNGAAKVEAVKAAIESGKVEKVAAAVADFLDQFGYMSMSTFERGVKVEVTATARATTYTDSVTLVLDVE